MTAQRFQTGRGGGGGGGETLDIPASLLGNKNKQTNKQTTTTTTLFKISHGTRSLITGDISCSQVRQLQLFDGWTLDSNHRAFHPSTRNHMVLRSKACEERGGAWSSRQNSLWRHKFNLVSKFKVLVFIRLKITTSQRTRGMGFRSKKHRTFTVSDTPVIETPPYTFETRFTRSKGAGGGDRMGVSWNWFHYYASCEWLF